MSATLRGPVVLSAARGVQVRITEEELTESERQSLRKRKSGRGEIIISSAK